MRLGGRIPQPDNDLIVKQPPAPVGFVTGVAGRYGLGVPAPVRDNPAPLVVAASLVAVEGALLVMYAVLELGSLSGQRLTMGLTTAVFFAAYGGGLLFCTWHLTRGQAWARGPVLMAQLIQLGVAWSFWGEGTTWVSICLGLVALLTLAGLLHPESMRTLNRE